MLGMQTVNVNESCTISSPIPSIRFGAPKSDNLSPSGSLIYSGGSMLAGVKFGSNFITTHTIVLRSSSRTVREIKARHQDLDKF